MAILAITEVRFGGRVARVTMRCTGCDYADDLRKEMRAWRYCPRCGERLHDRDTP